MAAITEVITTSDMVTIVAADGATIAAMAAGAGGTVPTDIIDGRQSEAPRASAAGS